ncbi:MAG: hypothetical protein M4579_005566 [Chaenotheca gracillima]|nr:MAG: hypothetical protein M4579_005566 [Chaenotheca gracillima]
MPTQLEPLMLPQKVEQDKKRLEARDSTGTNGGSSSGGEMDSPRLSASGHAHTSSTPEVVSPVTPTFSLRAHSRYSSSTSSVDSTVPSAVTAKANGNNSPLPLVESMESFRIAKSALPDVKEEPLEREDTYDMFDDQTELDDDFDVGIGSPRPSDELEMRQSPVIVPTTPDYDLTDSYFGFDENGMCPIAKQRRQDESTLATLTLRLNRRFPSLNRRWRGRKISNASVAESSRDMDPSRTASSRASSVSRSMYDSSERQDAYQPPTPPMSMTDDEGINSTAPVSIEPRPTSKQDDRNDGLATTPLLPPLVIPENTTSIRPTPVQSPLQSPAIADSNGYYSTVASPMGSAYTPQHAGLGSPPLSTRPSMSSIHHHHQMSGHLVPCSDIPGIKLADPNDEWSYKLGHANFDIHPEPYFPQSLDLESSRQMRTDWETARFNYTKHVVRTGEHYGVTSKTYQLTQEKWTDIENQWRRCQDQLLIHAEQAGEDVDAIREASAEPAPVMKVPSIQNARSEGKFPHLGDNDIVGPMEQAASLNLQPKPSSRRRATLLKFLQDVGGKLTQTSMPKSP